MDILQEAFWVHISGCKMFKVVKRLYFFFEKRLKVMNTQDIRNIVPETKNDRDALTIIKLFCSVTL